LRPMREEARRGEMEDRKEMCRLEEWKEIWG
jgi:hypothetical protein